MRVDVRDLQVGDEHHGPDGLRWTVDLESYPIRREGVEFLRVRVRRPDGSVDRLTFDTITLVDIERP